MAHAFDLEVAEACLASGVDEVHLPWWKLSGARIRDGIVIELPRIIHDEELDQILEFLTTGLAQRASVPSSQGSSSLDVSIGNLGFFEILSDLDVNMQAAWPLSVTNACSAEEIARMGASSIWLSPELDKRRISTVASSASVPTGVAVYGRQELMVSEHCVLSTGGCSNECETCLLRRDWHELKDAKGYRFPVTSDPTGRSHIFNSVPLDLTHVMSEVLDTGVEMLRVDLTLESPEEAAIIIRDIRDSVTLALEDAGSLERREDTTSGHFFRGVH